jgi:DNA polymerase-3 subunit epsilon
VGVPPPPPRAARRGSWLEAEFASLDFETTGLDLASDSVVSWGVLPVTRGGIELAGADYRLVVPARPPGEASIRVHELRPSDLATAPSLAEVAPALHEALAGRFVLAWAATIEATFLRRIFGGSARSWRRRMLDVRDLARARLIREGSSQSTGRGFDLEAACRRYGVPVERTHHAFDDALMTAELFLVLAGKLAAEHGRQPRVAQLRKEARPPFRHTA